MPMGMPVAGREKTLLFVGFLTVILMTGAVTYIGYQKLQQVEAERLESDRQFDKEHTVHRMRDAVRKRIISLTRTATLSDYFERDEEQQRFFGYARDFINARARLVATGLDPTEQDMIADIDAQARTQQPFMEKTMALLVDDPMAEGGSEALSTALDSQDKFLATLDRIIAYQESLGADRRKAASLHQRETQTVFLLGSAYVIFFSVLIAIYITRQTSQRTSLLVEENQKRQRAEQEVRNLNRDLEVRVEERTRSLQEEISERQKVEARLRESEAHSRTIVESAAVGILTFSEYGMIESFNPAAERIFAFRASDIIHRPVSLLMPALMDHIPDGKSGSGGELDIVGHKANGDTFPAHLSIGTFSISGSRKTVVMVQDVSEQRNAEQQILHAIEQAENANRSKSDFLANMSHELRTPLNAIIGYSEAMKMETFGPLGHDKYKEYMINIIHSGRHLLDLVNDILDISAIEAGQMELREETFDLQSVARETLEHIRGWAMREGIQLVMDAGGPPVLVWADRRRIRQILLNVLSNAIKFTPENGSVSVDIHVLADGSPQASITDTGPGLAPEDIPRAFSAFQQINRGTVGRHEGSGLGLALSQSFAELHGGSLLMESILGEGTTVHLTLPGNRAVSNGEEGGNG